MKKQLFSISNEQGFFLPYVLFIISLVFIIITTNINSYRNDIHITESHMEQLKIETLFQMGRTSLLEELKKEQTPIEKVTYIFPEGTVEIKIASETNGRSKLDFFLETNNDSNYLITNYLIAENEIPVIE
ncbi:hypothetical protein CIL05_13950 [Virgibacillus profundi]|uniref:Competence protein ComG n=1 Tax=Virgibacillus profundi TaxID=2024555 RepID=A0A2A2IDC5_9BACI|nr:hypothetical protein [Virgibacillus profundi]PAV29073.1 hypothetical protein CIL05_13950 [Virgibacillus profundi]PXY53242.1 hypothetical protein CIT14_14075 [Virgibacillus profundi]